MRDDVQILFSNLSSLNKKKLNLINGLYVRNADIHYYLKSDDIENINDSILNFNHVINEINLIDYEISQLTGEICKKNGISRNQFDSLIKTNLNKTIIEIKQIQQKIETTLESLFYEKEKLISLMKEKAHTLQKNINDISNIRKLNYKK